MRKSTTNVVVGAAVLAMVLMVTGVVRAGPSAGAPMEMPGLKAAAWIVRDTDGIPHIRAQNEHDLFFLQGWVHAEDRLFQMDVLRRTASGTLAELLGPGALGSDVMLRTMGLRRAAEGSVAASSPRALAALEAYAEGVNAYVGTHLLPPEYGLLELTQFEPWTPVDSYAWGHLMCFSLAFFLDIDETLRFQTCVSKLGLEAGSALYYEDLRRCAPFDPASTVPDASTGSLSMPVKLRGRGRGKMASTSGGGIPPTVVDLCRKYRRKVEGIPLFKRILEDERDGSNWWVVSGAHTTSRRPLLASDPHLGLETPMVWYPIGLHARRIQIVGSSLLGIPTVIMGHNKHIAWGMTNTAWDVTDTFQEQVVPDGSSPSGLSTVYMDEMEHIIPIPEEFRQNNPGNGVLDDITVVPPGGPIPPVTLIVPRRNNGPIIQLDMGMRTALSVQYVGFSPTRQLETFLLLDEARDLHDFIAGVQYFDIGSQHFSYADVKGNIAFLGSGEIPIREDLQAGTVNGLPPWFIRNGTGGNEWVSLEDPPPDQATPYEVLPFWELPHIINPPAGWIVQANNDAAGVTLDGDPLNQFRPDGGIYYLMYNYAGGFRAGRITQMIRDKLAAGEKISFEDMQEMQADVVMRDAQVFVPYILEAFENALGPGAHPSLAALAADAGVAEAVERLSLWECNTPTGIPEGYDASDVDGNLSEPSEEEIQASIATTIYTAWRREFIMNTMDAVLDPLGLPRPLGWSSLAALRHLLDNFDTTQGIGASGLNFFEVPGVPDAADRRDILLLKSVQDALARLSGPKFADAFGGSINQDDYRWGLLHRIVFKHILGEPFSIPPAGGAFPHPLEGLAGIPTDGGYRVVDASGHGERAGSVNKFMFDGGPSRRFVAELSRWRLRSESSWPGGVSGVIGNPHYCNLLPRWLTNDSLPLLLRTCDIWRKAESITIFVPPPRWRPWRR